MSKRRVAESDYVGRIRLLQRDNIWEKRCADCRDGSPIYVCMDYMSFVCTVCSGIHREFGHKVKGISISKWTADEVSQIEKNGGNKKCRDKYLARWTAEELPEPAAEAVADIRNFLKLKYVEQKWINTESDASPSSKEKLKKKSEAPTKKALSQLAKTIDETASEASYPSGIPKKSSEQSSRKNKGAAMNGDISRDSPHFEGVPFQESYPMNGAHNSSYLPAQMVYPSPIETGAFYGFPEVQPPPPPSPLYGNKPRPRMSVPPSTMPAYPYQPPLNSVQQRHFYQLLPSSLPSYLHSPTSHQPLAPLQYSPPRPTPSVGELMSIFQPYSQYVSRTPMVDRNPFRENTELNSMPSTLPYSGMAPPMRQQPSYMMPVQPVMGMVSPGYSSRMNPFAN
ncbi:hypothetical protein IE077_000077 [Cardiosporidium cionae]|uniref:Arf-GAP domain-containing protein n=1 Tax=Cardiosporidium cionae TaxID=476202 RepID=A0ABQ7J5V7_9APIC|nr:hypothetical protein IE077_000077 [Cardiosporidium cionae]|eukprot:KAF8819379.1 hypothetical protein IE077_000077 [Cardiosporidium cionae]